jgi:hypothetical protein
VDDDDQIHCWLGEPARVDLFVLLPNPDGLDLVTGEDGPDTAVGRLARLERVAL